MTPAVIEARRRGIAFQLHEYAHDPGKSAYGAEAAAALGVTPERVLKTLVVAAPDGNLAVAVLPVPLELDLKALASVWGRKRLALAPVAAAERVTGYVTGGISPLGQKRRLPAWIHEGAGDWDTVFVSGGRRGLEIELAPADLVQTIRGRWAAIGRRRDTAAAGRAGTP